MKSMKTLACLGRPVLATALLLTLLLGASLPARALVVLQYHHVSEGTPKSTSISPARFAEHMRWLQENKYEVVGMEQLIEWLKQGAPLPDKAVVITFDDGYRSIYENAWPILKRNSWPFTVFINTQHHDERNQQYMSWQQLEELAKKGGTLGNHSVSHEHMVRRRSGETDKQWLARVTDEITSAQGKIDRRVGKQPKVFAYPFGEYNRQLQGILQERGYIAFGQQSGPIAPFDQPTALPRFPFGGNYGAAEDFKVKVSSLPLPIEKAELVDEGGRALAEPLLPQGVHKPTLQLTGRPDILAKVQCFAGANGVQMSLSGTQLQVQVKKPFPAGRSRYNCTAPADGVHYWYSHLIMKKFPDGRWYEE